MEEKGVWRVVVAERVVGGEGWMEGGGGREGRWRRGVDGGEW